MNKLEISDKVVYQLENPINVSPNFKNFSSFIETTVSSGDVIKKGDSVTLFEVLISSLVNGLDLSVEKELLNKGISPESDIYNEAFNNVQKGHFDIFKHYYLQLDTATKVDFLKIFENRWSKCVEGFFKGFVNILCSGVNISAAHYNKHYNLINDCLNSITDFKSPEDFKDSLYGNIVNNVRYVRYIVEIDKEALGCFQNIELEKWEDFHKEMLYDKPNISYNFSKSKEQWKRMGKFLSNFDITNFDKNSFDYKISRNIYNDAMSFLVSKKSDCEDFWLGYNSITKNIYRDYLGNISNDELFKVYEDVKNESFYYVSEKRVLTSFLLLMEVKREYEKRKLNWDESFITRDFFIHKDDSVEIHEENIIKYIYLLYIESKAINKHDFGFDVVFKGLEKGKVKALYELKSSAERLEKLNHKGYVVKEEDYIKDLSYVDFYSWNFSFEDLAKNLDAELKSYGELTKRENGVIGFNTVFKFKDKEDAKFFHEFIKSDFFNSDVNIELIVSLRDQWTMKKDLQESAEISNVKKRGVKF